MHAQAVDLDIMRREEIRQVSEAFVRRTEDRA
jgi:hypothetical protein